MDERGDREGVLESLGRKASCGSSKKMREGAGEIQTREKKVTQWNIQVRSSINLILWFAVGIQDPKNACSVFASDNFVDFFSPARGWILTWVWCLIMALRTSNVSPLSRSTPLHHQSSTFWGPFDLFIHRLHHHKN